MSKTLKFTADLAPLILSGEKTSTWRLFDDKNLQTGDIVDLVKRPELDVFAQAKLTSVSEKPLGQLTTEDKTGHGTYASADEMYSAFAKCYNRPINPETPVKICKFRLLTKGEKCLK